MVARRTRSFGESEWLCRERRTPCLFQAWASGLSEVARKGGGIGEETSTSGWDRTRGRYPGASGS